MWSHLRYLSLLYLSLTQAAIANAKTLEEVEMLNKMLQSGQIPGRENGKMPTGGNFKPIKNQHLISRFFFSYLY